MSAYLVENETIGRVMRAIEKSGRHGREYLLIDELKNELQKNPMKVFFRLFDLNIKSLQQRYEDQKDIVPTAEDYKQAKKVFNQPFGTSDYQLLKSLKCYLYQSCEGNCTKDDLYKAVDCVSENISSDIISQIPQYNEAKWG